MKAYKFILENEIPMDDPAIDPNSMYDQQSQNSNMMQQENPVDDFEPLIKSVKDIPHSKEKAETLKIAAQIRQIEAQTKETLAKANNPDVGMDQQIDPMTGQPMDPNMAGGQIDPMTGMPIQQPQIDPMTGMPMDPSANQPQDPLMGFGDASAPQNPMGGGMGGVDPMTGMPMDLNAPTKTFTAIGRAFKLKKIYDILYNISRLLHLTPDDKLQKISKQVDEVFELFRLVVNNLKIYKDKIDELIVMYYALLKDICDNIEDIYKERKLDTNITESKRIRKKISLLGEGIDD